jgi:hypothetical protein
MVHLPNGKDASSLGKGAPKRQTNVLDGIQAQPINVESFHQPRDPLGQRLLHPLCLLVQIRQDLQPAVLHFWLVVKISNGTRVMERRGRVKGARQLPIRIPIGDGPHVVGHHVYHHPDIALVAFVNQVPEARLAPETLIHAVNVLGKVA